MIKIDNLQTANFHWQTALSLANSSKLVYRDGSSIEKSLLERRGFKNYRFISVNDTQLFVASNGSNTIVCFRGTLGVADWINNLDIVWTNQIYGRVHSGFYKAYHDAHQAIEAELASLGPDQKIWVTGHSLGGALAAICLAELHPTRADQIQACYTYGQPRIGDRAFRNFMRNNYGNRYYRFVNYNDIITRIPPFFSHVGRLIRFHADGSLITSPDGVQRSGLESSEFVVENDPMEESSSDENKGDATPLSEAEFEELKAVGLGVTHSEHTESITEGVILEGVSAVFGDHLIDKYISKIIPFERSNRNNESTKTAQVDFHVDSLSKAPPMQDPDWVERGDLSIEESLEFDIPLIPVLIRAIGKWDPYGDLVIHSKIGSIYTAQVTADQLEQLRFDPNIHSIQRSPNNYIKDLAESVPFVKADTIHRSPHDEKGDQAIIGVIDTGIDILHEAFTVAGNPTKSRILYIWDQRGSVEDNRRPNDIDGGFSAKYGRVYTRLDIEGFMANRGQTPPALRDPDGHGTHVSGIAAGRAVDQLGDGVAPEAKIIAVIADMDTDDNNPHSLGYSITHLDGLLFLKEAAQIEQLPIAINVSSGMNAGSHDGTSTLEAGFDTITGLGRDPGIAIVKSAGNERTFSGHAIVNVATNLNEVVSWQSSHFARAEDYIEGWYDNLDDLEFTLIDPQGNESPPISFDENEDLLDQPKSVAELLGTNLIELRLTPLHPDNGNSQIQIVIKNGTDSIQAGVWQLRIFGKSITSETSRIDFWIERNDFRPVSFQLGADPNMTLSVPGTANTVITVAACAPEGPPIQLYANSSYGPTRTGFAKPELTAPGEGIVSAQSNTDNHTDAVALSGTSMAAPHVTGAIALALSKRKKADDLPQLNGQQIRRLLIQTSSDVNGRHHPGRGYGVLNVEALLNQI